MTFKLKQLGLALAAGALLLAGAAQAADPKVLNIYNWSDYIALDTTQNFEKETGIKVRHPAPGHPGLHQFRVWLVGALVA